MPVLLLSVIMHLIIMLKVTAPCMSGLGNSGIRFDLNYSVINKMKQNI